MIILSSIHTICLIMSYVFQITDQEVEDAHCTEEELWDKTTRTILTRFTKLNDFLKIKFAVNPSVKSSSPRQSVAVQRRREEQVRCVLFLCYNSSVLVVFMQRMYRNQLHLHVVFSQNLLCQAMCC